MVPQRPLIMEFSDERRSPKPLRRCSFTMWELSRYFFCQFLDITNKIAREREIRNEDMFFSSFSHLHMSVNGEYMNASLKVF